MSSPPRKTLGLKAAAPARDPRRRPVRPGAPPVKGAPHPEPADDPKARAAGPRPKPATPKPGPRGPAKGAPMQQRGPASGAANRGGGTDERRPARPSKPGSFPAGKAAHGQPQRQGQPTPASRRGPDASPAGSPFGARGRDDTMPARGPRPPHDPGCRPPPGAGRQDPRRGGPPNDLGDDPRRRARDVRRDTTSTSSPRSRDDAPRHEARSHGEREAPPRKRPPARAELPTTPRPAAPRTSGEDAANEGQRLSKQLAEQGLASRREADEWIEAGWVRVDGRMAVLGQRVLPHQRIEIDPAAHQQQAQRVTVLLHKPLGYVSGQAEDGHEPAAVLVTQDNHWAGDDSRIRFHPGQLRGLAPAGRLDMDSTGLLVLTQDGRVAKHLIGEDSQVEKEYLVRVEPIAEGSVKPDALALLQHGLWLDEQPLKPAKVSWQSEQQLRVVLREGRKRQIRRMCELVGYKVVALKRVRIGSIVLGALPPGQWRYLGPHEHF